MLSIRRRQSPYALQNASSFGSPDPGWPGWGEFGPMLLRSAGIAGLAGVIMVIAAGNVFFSEPQRSASVQDDASPGGVIVAASLAQDGTAPSMIVAAGEAAAAAIEMPAVAVEAEKALADLSVTAESPAVPEPAATEPTAARAEPAASSVLETSFALSSPSPYSPSDLMRFQVAVASPTSGQETAAPVAMPAVGSEPGVEEPQGEAEGDADDLWATEAVECPRNWLDVSDGAAAAADAAGCDADVALVAAPPAPVASDPLRGALDMAPDSAGTDEELESALATQALKVVGFVARVPEPRPNPPPVRRVSSRSSSWPSTPPPNCGKLHAYWRFTDRQAGTKEWYCR